MAGNQLDARCVWTWTASCGNYRIILCFTSLNYRGSPLHVGGWDGKYPDAYNWLYIQRWHDGPVQNSNQGYKFWNQDEVKRLIELKREGKSWRDISVSYRLDLATRPIRILTCYFSGPLSWTIYRSAQADISQAKINCWRTDAPSRQGKGRSAGGIKKSVCFG